MTTIGTIVHGMAVAHGMAVIIVHGVTVIRTVVMAILPVVMAVTRTVTATSNKVRLRQRRPLKVQPHSPLILPIQRIPTRERFVNAYEYQLNRFVQLNSCNNQRASRARCFFLDWIWIRVIAKRRQRLGWRRQHVIDFFAPVQRWQLALFK